MARPKKHPRLPNGFGSIKKLSGRHRANPYGVYPPTEDFDEDGRPVAVKALAYVDDWYYGVSILTAYHAGTYVPGVYPPRPAAGTRDNADLSGAVRDILRDYSKVRSAVTGADEPVPGVTFEEIFWMFYNSKYENGKRAYSQSSKNQAIAAFKNCASLHKKEFSTLRHSDLQKVIDDCTLRYASLETIVSLYHQMYAFADREGLAEKDYSANVKINIEDDDEHGVPFTEEELKILWNNEKDPVIEFLLIMCYSGYRITAYKNLEINLKDNYFRGGIKTKAGKNRIVPIHPDILPLVRRRIKRDGSLLPVTVGAYRNEMYQKLKELGISRHTPHDCRHTFSWLCERYGVRENDRKRMLGHSFKDDITNKVYGHRTLDELRTEICKIKVCR